MIGDQYLQTRAQLGTALFSLSNLAHGLHAGREVLQTLQDLRGSLREPFLFLVAGEEKAGKSSLVNALLGREIIPPGPAHDGGKIHIYKYGPEESEVPVYEQFVEHYRPDSMLRDFNIVDTPASSIITHQHLAVVDQLLPETDLVLFVFSITNPWSSSSQEFLSHIGAKLPRNAVFVLQQCDLRDATEVHAVAKHLEQSIREKFPQECRVFPVSAKKAFLSRTTATDREGLFQQSNFGPLESYISDIVANCKERTDALRSACRTAQTILAGIAEKTRDTFSAITKDKEILAELNLDLEERRAQTMRQVGSVQWAIAQSFERLQKRGEELMQQKGGDKLKPPVDPKLEDSVLRQIQHSLELLEGDLQQVWPELNEIIRKRFPEGNPPVQPDDIAGERADLLRQIGRSIMEKRAPDYFGRQMPALFEKMTGWLQTPPEEAKQGNLDVFSTAIARIAIADFYHALAAATAMQGKLSALGKGAKIMAQFRAEMAYKREELVATLEGHLRHAAELYFREPTTALQPMQNFCSKQLNIYEPRIALAKQMEETLAKTAASLGLPVQAPEPQPA